MLPDQFWSAFLVILTILPHLYCLLLNQQSFTKNDDKGPDSKLMTSDDTDTTVSTTPQAQRLEVGTVQNSKLKTANMNFEELYLSTVIICYLLL